MGESSAVVTSAKFKRKANRVILRSDLSCVWPAIESRASNGQRHDDDGQQKRYRQVDKEKLEGSQFVCLLAESFKFKSSK